MVNSVCQLGWGVVPSYFARHDSEYIRVLDEMKT